MEELKQLNKKVDRVLFILSDDEKMGHTGLGTDVKHLKKATHQNSEDILELKKKVSRKNYLSIFKGVSIGGGFVGGIAKFWTELKAIVVHLFG